MDQKIANIDRFMRHTELYMSLSGKCAERLDVNDIKMISRYIELQKQLEELTGGRIACRRSTGHAVSQTKMRG